MTRVFISYRGEDSLTSAAFIRRELAARFGEDRVFLDSTSIPIGTDFAEVLLGRLSMCSVLLAVIGPRWLAARDGGGRRRIDDPDDWVRRELVEAFRLGIRCVPILLDDAQLPRAAELPADIAELSRRQYVHLRRRYTDDDLASLVKKLASDDAALTSTPEPRGIGIGPIPRQLPTVGRHFVGRDDELRELDRLLEEAAEESYAVVISAVGGTAGVGKTALALRWAHRVRDRFPDGDLYVDLRGYGPGSAVRPEAALAGFLRALGIPGEDIPAELEERAASFRTMTAQRRMLLVLDNAADEEQIRPLLPGTPRCFVLTTSRDSLGGLVALDGANRIVLDLLSPAEANDLLLHLIGRRAEVEAEATRELSDHCARLPLALRIAAELAASRPQARLAELVAELADEGGRLDLLDASGGGTSAVRTVFSWSYRRLPANVARAFRLIGCHPGPSLDVDAVAALTGERDWQSKKIVGILLRANLLEEGTAGHFNMHDLLRSYAGELSLREERAGGQRVALRRLFDHYIVTASQAADTLAPHERDRHRRLPTSSPSRFTDATAAMAWLERERANLIAAGLYAADHGMVEDIVDMATVLYRFLETRAYDDDALSLQAAALAALSQNRNQAEKARTTTDMGVVLGRAGRYTEALELLAQAITLAETVNDRTTLRRALNGRGAWLQHLGRYEEAQDDHLRACELARQDRSVMGEAHGLSNLGTLYQRLERWNDALERHTLALAIFADSNNYTAQGRQLNNLGFVHLKLGHPREARSFFIQAVKLAHRNRNRRIESAGLDGLGLTSLAAGQADEALTYYGQALEMAENIRDRHSQARAHDGLAQAYHALEQDQDAEYHWQQALLLYTSLRTPDTDRIAAALTMLRTAAEQHRPDTR